MNAAVLSNLASPLGYAAVDAGKQTLGAGHKAYQESRAEGKGVIASTGKAVKAGLTGAKDAVFSTGTNFAQNLVPRGLNSAASFVA